jgi:hypothetical protein
LSVWLVGFCFSFPIVSPRLLGTAVFDRGAVAVRFGLAFDTVGLPMREKIMKRGLFYSVKIGLKNNVQCCILSLKESISLNSKHPRGCAINELTVFSQR